jgi:hypothetical protein
LAWLPSSLLILLYLLSTPLRAGQAASEIPLGGRAKLGPDGTIAKLKVERKEKLQKRLEKCGFLRAGAQMTRKNVGSARIQRPQVMLAFVLLNGGAREFERREGSVRIP